MPTYVLIQVEAYCGYRANERPLAFVWNGQRHEIEEIIDRWYQGGVSARDQKLDYFKVRTRDGQKYILRYNSLFDTWSVLATDQVLD